MSGRYAAFGLWPHSTILLVPDDVSPAGALAYEPRLGICTVVRGYEDISKPRPQGRSMIIDAWMRLRKHAFPLPTTGVVRAHVQVQEASRDTSVVVNSIRFEDASDRSAERRLLATASIADLIDASARFEDFYSTAARERNAWRLTAGAVCLAMVAVSFAIACVAAANSSRGNTE